MKLIIYLFIQIKPKLAERLKDLPKKLSSFTWDKITLTLLLKSTDQDEIK